MKTARDYLLATLQRIVAGGDLTTDELGRAIPDPRLLDDRSEMDAWEELSHWADDDDIRAKDARYREHKRERMRGHIARLGDQPPLLD